MFNSLNKNSSDEDLMRGICNGNKQAFEWLYERYYNKLIGFCKKLLANNETQAEDIVQEVFIKIIDKPERFDTNRKFSTWVFTLAKNLCYNYVRDENNREMILNNNIEKNVTTYSKINIDSTIIKNGLDKALLELNHKERLIFILRFEYELNIKQIAQIADIPIGSVKSCIYYLLKKLSSQLKQFIDENRH